MGEIMPTLSGAEATRGTCVSLHTTVTQARETIFSLTCLFLFVCGGGGVCG